MLKIAISGIIGIFVLILVSSPALAEGVVHGQSYTCDRIEYFYKKGCPHCQAAGEFLSELEQNQPVLNIQRYDVYDSNLGQPKFLDVIKLYDIRQPGVPLFLVCNQLLIGFDNQETTGMQIISLLGMKTEKITRNNGTNVIELPYFGKLDINQYSLPVITLIIGLVDGFNPCAMWVLLFLLSILLNLHNRLRILLIAGTFVLVSGIIYFAFMAAWLNLFLIIGLSRMLQLCVGFIAIFIGIIHVKDFFVYKKGISLSIPEKSKPGIYAGIRKVIYADSLVMSLAAVIILAALVNTVELLCTAGLPALYTQILVLQSLSKLQYYGYLVLYNLAYIFDDALMVAIVVYTLSCTKLQEKTGRYLKLVSGTIIIILGGILIISPDMMI